MNALINTLTTEVKSTSLKLILVCNKFQELSTQKPSWIQIEELKRLKVALSDILGEDK